MSWQSLSKAVWSGGPHEGRKLVSLTRFMDETPECGVVSHLCVFMKTQSWALSYLAPP